MLHQSHKHHPMQKHIQNAFSTITEGMQMYGTLKGAFELGQGIYRGAQTAYQVAAPIAAALL